MGQFEVLAFKRDLVLLHGFQQRGLCFGRGTVDLVRQKDVGEYGTFAQDELVFAAVKNESTGNITGKQVRRELDPFKIQTQGGCKTIGDEGLCQAGIIFKEDMPAGRQECRH